MNRKKEMVKFETPFGTFVCSKTTIDKFNEMLEKNPELGDFFCEYVDYLFCCKSKYDILQTIYKLYEKEDFSKWRKEWRRNK